jgi:hypothetical protein
MIVYPQNAPHGPLPMDRVNDVRARVTRPMGTTLPFRVFNGLFFVPETVTTIGTARNEGRWDRTGTQQLLKKSTVVFD